MSERNTDHVLLRGNIFHCLHCGHRYLMNTPCPLLVMTAAMNAFVQLHAGCVDDRVYVEVDPDFREVGQ